MDMDKEDKAVTYEAKGDGARTTVTYQTGPLKGWTIEVIHKDVSAIGRGFLRISPKDVKVRAHYVDTALLFRWDEKGRFFVDDATGLDALEGQPVDWKAVREAAKDALFEHLATLGWEYLEKEGSMYLYSHIFQEVMTAEDLRGIRDDCLKAFNSTAMSAEQMAAEIEADPILAPDFDLSSRYYVVPTAPDDWGAYEAFDGPRDLKNFLDYADKHRYIWWEDEEEEGEE